mgnify:CR=1 FL=1
MTLQGLDRTLNVYRIGDPDGKFPIFDATGSTYAPGRWNHADTPVIYAGEHYSTAMLEKLVHAAGLLPPNQHYIEITLPQRLSYEQVTKDHLPGWDNEDAAVSTAYGRQWVIDARSAVLLVPSFVARIEHNAVINPAHPEFERIEYSLPVPVWWDARLFTR